MNSLTSVLIGMVAMASLTAALFFWRFWRQTHDSFFVLFALAFAIHAGAWFALGALQVSEETEPFLFIPHLVMFGLIILAIVLKNLPRNPGT